jgi:hypothetical protein
MSDLYLLLTPVLGLVVLGLAGFVGCQTIIGPPYSSDNPLVDGENLMAPRSDYTGWVGMVIVPRTETQTVYAIGRFCLPGNNRSHDLKIVDAATGADVPGSLGVVELAGQPENKFAYADLTQHPPTLQANLKYYVLSREMAAGDQFFDFSTTVTVPDDRPFAVTAAVFGDPDAGVPYAEAGGVNHAYGPVDIHYVKEA